MILIVLLLFLTQTAAALEVESYEYNIGAGINTIDLGKTYDGHYVSEINGSFYPISNFPGRYIQYITFTAADTRDNVLINVTIPKNSNMNANFSDLRFFHSEGLSTIPYYISYYNSTHAEVSMRINVAAGSNSLIMSFGNPDSTTTSNLSSLYMFYLNNSSGQNYSSNITIYTGIYTNIDLYATPYTAGTSERVSYIFNESNKPRIQHRDSTTGGDLYVYFNTSDMFSTGTNGNNGYSHQMNLSINDNGTVCLDYKKYRNSVLNQTLIVNGNETAATPFNTFGLSFVGVSSSLIYDVRIYNTTKVTDVNFGSVTEVLENSSTVSIPVPADKFSTLTYNSSSHGLLVLDLFFEPHAVMSTPPEAIFEENVILQFGVSPHNLLIDYQIALDDGFYSVVNSGSSTGNISTPLPAGQYYWRLMQPDGIYTETRNFTVMDAQPIAGHLNFVIKDELTNINTSAIVILSNNTTTLQKTGANTGFNSTEVIAGNYTVQVKQNNYSTRFYEVESPGNYTLYILPTNLTTNNASVVYFSLIDNTNTFQYDSTKLEIIKPTPNGSVLIQNSYFDASGFVVATLNQFDNYILKVVSDSGHERILGNYIQAGQTTTQLVISDIDLKDSNMSVHAGFRYNLTKSDETVKFDWLNPNNSLKEPLLFQIYKNNELVMNISTGAPFGSINYYDNVAGEMKLDPDATYRIVMTAKTANGTIKINEYYKVGEESVGIDFEKIPLALRIVISLILLILVASMFNITNAKFASIVVSFIALFLAGLIGFLPISVGLLVWMLFISVVAFKTNR